MTGWGLPVSPDEDDATARVIAKSLRAEAERFRVAEQERLAEARALGVARMSCIRQAAKIERTIRGIG